MATMLEKYATATVPRYTSYPPAPHFRAGFPATTYRDWLSALDPARPLSLYTRAFCRQLCSYCGCNMKLASLERALHREPDLLFIERLTHELIDRCRRHGWSGKAGLGIEREQADDLGM